ncbi:hypothetical protein V8J36_09490 [Frigidibacter sp. MR17.14]|uniref:hypothetical protein n=1 Tax=Frigidibacter sp. MR17.14 TaxID=3126509 RepID=UPI003012E732
MSACTLHGLVSFAIRRGRHDWIAIGLAAVFGALVPAFVTAPVISGIHMATVSALSAAFTIWLLFPAFGHVEGACGVFCDAALMFLATVLTALLAGSMVVPVFGTAAALVVLFCWLFEEPAFFRLWLLATVVFLALARLRRRAEGF